LCAFHFLSILFLHSSSHPSLFPSLVFFLCSYIYCSLISLYFHTFPLSSVFHHFNFISW
jgi:hypothetical protein